jgi:hypothetical protein
MSGTQRQTHILRCRIDEEMASAVERAAANDDRSASDWVRVVLRRELRRLRVLGRSKATQPLHRNAGSLASLLLALSLLLAAPVTCYAAQAQTASSQSDSAIAADFEKRFMAALSRLRHRYAVNAIEQFGPDWKYEPYRGKWIKRGCIIGQFSFDVQRTQSLVSPIVAVAEGPTESLATDVFDTRAEVESAPLHLDGSSALADKLVRINYARRGGRWVLTGASYRNDEGWQDLWQGPLGRRDHSFCLDADLLELR